MSRLSRWKYDRENLVRIIGTYRDGSRHLASRAEGIEKLELHAQADTAEWLLDLVRARVRHDG